MQMVFIPNPFSPLWEKESKRSAFKLLVSVLGQGVRERAKPPIYTFGMRPRALRSQLVSYKNGVSGKIRIFFSQSVANREFSPPEFARLECKVLIAYLYFVAFFSFIAAVVPDVPSEQPSFG